MLPELNEHVDTCDKGKYQSNIEVTAVNDTFGVEDEVLPELTGGEEAVEMLHKLVDIDHVDNDTAGKPLHPTSKDHILTLQPFVFPS